MNKRLLIYVFLICTFSSYSLDERSVIKKIDSINTLALDHYNNNDFMLSINAFSQAIKLSDSINDSYGIAVANFTLGRIYSYMKEYEDAERCYLKLLDASNEIGDNFLIANAYMSLGEVYWHENESTNVIDYFKKAYTYAQKKDVRDLNNKDKKENVLFNIRMNLTRAYLEMDNTSEALIHLLRAEENLDNASFSIYNEGYFSYMYGRYFLQKKSYYKANSKFEEALAFIEDKHTSEDYIQKELLSSIYKSYSQSQAALGNGDEAYQVLLKYNHSLEGLMNAESLKQENIAKSKLLIAEYKRDAELANEEMLLQEQLTRKMERINVITYLAIILLGVFLIAIYKNYLSKRKLSTILESRNLQLERAKEAAEKSSELKSNFISNVTHELRTPLYGVVGLTSLLLKSNDLSDRDNKFLKSLKFSGDYLLNLINDILQVGKMESQNVELQETTVNLKTLIENISDSFEYRLQENNNELCIRIDERLPEYVKCDNVRLSQIFINLVGNSIKFTNNGKIEVSADVLEKTEDNVSLRFTVKDNGPGIPKAQHKKIFENFSQVNEKMNIDYQGTGLGLSIAKNLVELFGGQIELVSDVGQGAEFAFEVSFEIDQVSSEIIGDELDENKTISLMDRHLILVAEDNKINQIVTQNVLEKGNFECEIVENGLEALNAVQSKQYDLVLMDLNMPVMNGMDATKEIRKFNPTIPIIALTAADIEEVKNDFTSKGFCDVITKPFDNFEFYQKITACIQNYKLEVNREAKLVKVS
ncbi:MAG: response regulator [Flavobacteriaceae bacterium]|nr:response regulator [Bacteroidia bacterium]NNF73593.1 response regulator [Flavobacteriaceae bacterium]